jgi:hypothetical protein
MATPVELQIVFDPGGAVTGFKVIGDAGDAMGAKIVSASQAATLALNNQISSTSKAAGQVAILTAQWEAEQEAVTKANQALGAQSSTVNAATSSFQGLTSEQTRANVAGRLLEQTFGLQNRALNQVLSRSATLGPLLASAFNIAIFASVVPMIEKIGEEIINVTNDLGGYTAGVQQAYKDTVQASQQAFINPKTIEIAQQHLDLVNQEVSKLNAASTAQVTRNQLVSAQTTLEGKIIAFLGNGLIQQAASASLQAKAVEKDQQRVQLLQAQADLTKQMNDAIAQSQESTALIGKSGFSQIAQQHTNALADINRAFTGTSSNGAAAQAARIDAENRMNAELLQLRKQLAQETMTINDQVTENNLTGLAKIKQEETDHINELRVQLATKLGLSQTEVQQTALYQAQILKIHQDTAAKEAAINAAGEQQTETMEKAARDAGLAGDAKILADKQDSINKAVSAFAQGNITVTQYIRQIVAINQQANAQILSNDKATQDARALMMSKSLEQEQDAQSATAMAMVPPYLRAYAQINDEENKRLLQIDQNQRTLHDKYQDDAGALVQIDASAQAQRLAVWAETNQKIEEENQRLTQQLGSDIKSLFDDILDGNIGKRILSNIEALFAQIVAQWILSLGVMKSAFGGLFGSIVFGPGSTGANVFGGGGNPLSMLGLGFGSSATQVAGSSSGSFSIPGFSSQSTSVAGQSFTLPGISAGSGLGAAIAGTSATSGFGSASSALNTGTLEDALFGIGGSSPAAKSSASKGAGLSALFSGGNLAVLGGLGLALTGSMLGGKTGQVGGLLMGLLLSGKLGGVISTLFGTSLGLAGTGALVGGSIGGLLGFGVGQSSGGLLGSLTGAASGALSGFMVGGPIGALVGGIIGLIGGIFGGIFGGSKRKKQANDYANNTVLPDIQQIVTGFDGFQIDSSSAIQQLEQLRTDSQKQLSTLKSQGNDVFKNTVSPAIDAAEKHINDTQGERNVRANTLFGPPQFDTGGMFSVMRGSGNAGLAVLHDGEFVVNPQATKKNLPALMQMNSGGGGGNQFGDIHIHPTRLDRAYMNDPNGFKKDLRTTLNQMQREGQI